MSPTEPLYARSRSLNCNTPMIRPTEEQLAVLSRFERVAFEICDQVNRRPLVKSACHTYLRTFGASWVYHATRNLVHIDGVENIASLRPERGVLLVVNHRSFFDLYAISSVLLRNSSWVRRMYFPVRSTYFYERVDGVAVNAVMSALAMYPPILRDQNKRGFNQFSVELMAELSREPGTVIGIHPEGTRGKGPDPYQLLPPQLGVGQIVHAARPIVLPVFTLGLSNDFPRQVRGNFDGSGDPITVVFGAPVDLSDFYAQEPRARTFKAIAERLHDELGTLAGREKALRKRRGLPSLEVAPSP